MFSVQIDMVGGPLLEELSVYHVLCLQIWSRFFLLELAAEKFIYNMCITYQQNIYNIYIY